MKISLTTGDLSYHAGGMVPAIRELARNLRLRGHDVTIWGNCDKSSPTPSPDWNGIDTNLLPCLGPTTLSFRPNLVSQIVAKGADVIEVHGIWNYSSLAARLAAARLRIPFFVHPHGMLDPWALQHSKIRKRVASILFESKNLRSATCIRALNESELQAIRRVGLRQPVCIIPNGVANDPHDDGIREVKSNPMPYILYMGRLHPKKGLIELIRAWYLLQQSCSPSNEWKLLIAGFGTPKYENRLRALAVALGLRRSIEFLGTLTGKQKLNCLAGAECLILPSLSEGQPITVLEAWNEGRPVILTPQCNFSATDIQDTSVLTNPNATDIRDALESFIRLPEKIRRDMGLRAKRMAQDKYAWSSVAVKLEAVYRWALGHSARPSFVFN